MAILEGELSAELDRLSQKLVAETEAAFALQDERNALAQQCARLESQVQIMRQEAAVREEREKDSRTRISSLMIDRDMFREGFRQAKSEAKERDDDVQALKTQVKALKDFVSAGLRSEGQVTDEVFAEELSRLGSGLQNWVIQNFRRAKISTYSSLMKEFLEMIANLFGRCQSCKGGDQRSVVGLGPDVRITGFNGKIAPYTINHFTSSCNAYLRQMLYWSISSQGG
jgi:chromosome segregation ATPase